MGIGIAVVIDGKIHTGDHSSAGEFRSSSWRRTHPGQTGMNEERLRRIRDDADELRTLFSDVLGDLSPLVSVLDPADLILGGEFRRRHTMVEEILATDLKDAYIGAETCTCRIRLSSAGEWETATGAAWMFLENLFQVPVPARLRSANTLDWEQIFSLVGNRTTVGSA
jgi:hypothetical protein